jgi:hypothetical protein
MAKSQQLNFTQSLRFSGNTIAASDTTALKFLCSGGANDSVIKAISIASSDATSRNISLYIYDGTRNFLLSTATVAATSGTVGTVPSVDMLSSTYNPATPYDANGKRILPLPSGTSIFANTTATVAGTIFITVFTEDY